MVSCASQHVETWETLACPTLIAALVWFALATSALSLMVAAHHVANNQTLASMTMIVAKA
jgi:hypothetical protein